VALNSRWHAINLWAAEGTRIGFLEPLIAILPLAGGVQRVAARVGFARAFEIASSGTLYAAANFERWNIVNRVLAGNQLQAEAEAFACKLAAGPTLTYGGIKTLLRAWIRGGIRDAGGVTVTTVTPVIASEHARATIATYLKRLETQ
jgi:enoyl-CoA hydratase/carnithine racemase